MQNKKNCKHVTEGTSSPESPEGIAANNWRRVPNWRTEREREREKRIFPPSLPPVPRAGRSVPAHCPPGIIDKTNGSFQKTLMYCKEPEGRNIKDRRVKPWTASPSFRQDKSSRLFPSPRRRRRRRSSCLRLAFLRLSLSLSLVRVSSPFFRDLRRRD